jgi:RNA polymerase sigma factor (sigma-70 family)
MVEAPPDEENTRLALALLEDDEHAVEEILRLYGPGITETLHKKFTRHRGVLTYEDIEDVIVIALRRLWEARKDYDDKKQSLRVWFYCIAENVAKDVKKLGWHKASKLERHPGKDWLEDNPRRAAPETTTAEVKKEEPKEMKDMRAVVNKLPEVQRRIVLADSVARDDVASSADLAADLGIPVANVRVYRQRAMATIRKEMRKLGHNIPCKSGTHP